MASCPRSEIVLPGEVGVYHCWSRCVRRALLCGQDPYSGRNYDHRRALVRGFAERLAALFFVEVGFHAEMANHMHLVVRARPDLADTCSDHEVVRRALVFARLVKSKDGKTIKEPSDAEVRLEAKRPGRVEQLRRRLADVSAFIGGLCEHVALRCNREDGCTGHFWEDRYECRRLETEASILICGIYVDLNQIRAGEAATPEESVHTSAHDRIVAASGKDRDQDGWLCHLTLDERAAALQGPLVGSRTGRRASDDGLLSVTLEKYLELLDWTGRRTVQGKHGAIPSHLAPILERLKIKTEAWSDTVSNFHTLFGLVVGAPEHLAASAARAGRRWRRGGPACRSAFG